jgi:hypothetical protein
VERDIEVTAELSEAIDGPTVTSTSVTLAGPEGDVPGTVTVSDNVITFVPSRPLSLLATYTFTLEDTITDLAGNPLAQSESAEFSVREGAFGAPTHPFGTTISRLPRAVAANAFGDIVVGMEAVTGDQVDGAIFDTAENAWTPTSEITVGNIYSVAIDPARRAVAGLNNQTGFGWSRFTDQAEWVDAGALGAYPTVVTSPAGIATSVSRDMIVTDWSSRTLDLSDGTLGSPLGLPLPDTLSVDPMPIASLDDVAVVGVSDTMDGQEIYVLWNRGTGWSSPEQLVTPQMPGIGSFRAQGDTQGNIVIAWTDAQGLRARVYERANDAWTEPETVRAGAASALVYYPVITAGHVALASADSTGTWVNIYRAGTGWVASAELNIADPNASIGLSIDASGNALAVWDPVMNFRRYLAGSGWEAESDLDVNVDSSQMYMIGAPDGTAWVLVPDLAPAANGAILGVRFE